MNPLFIQQADPVGFLGTLAMVITFITWALILAAHSQP